MLTLSSYFSTVVASKPTRHWSLWRYSLWWRWLPYTWHWSHFSKLWRTFWSWSRSNNRQLQIVWGLKKFPSTIESCFDYSCYNLRSLYLWCVQMNTFSSPSSKPASSSLSFSRSNGGGSSKTHCSHNHSDEVISICSPLSNNARQKAISRLKEKKRART